jgi:hypothetical protein
VPLSDAAFAVYKILLEIIAQTWGNSTASLLQVPSLPASRQTSDL